MPATPDSFTPLDPGRINSMDPIELQHWCNEFKCTETELKSAIAAVGEHVTPVREHLASRMQKGRQGR